MRLRAVPLLCSFAALLLSCGNPTSSSSSSSSSSSEQKSDIPMQNPVDFGKYPLIEDASMIQKAWKVDYADTDNGLDGNSIVSMNYFKNGKYLAAPDPSIGEGDDVKLEFFAKDHARFIDVSSGYGVTIPLEKGFKVDYEFARNGMKFISDEETVRLSYETVRPYAPTAQNYQVYWNEWTVPYLQNPAYIEENDMEYFLPSLDQSRSIIPGHLVTTFHIHIKNAGSLEKSYYNFAFIKKSSSHAGYFFIHLKSKTSDQSTFDEILRSYVRFSEIGTPKIYMPAQKSIPNPNWNEKTSSYYQNMKSKEIPDFGFFLESLPNADTDDLNKAKDFILEELAWMESEENMAHQAEIISTYTHLYWYEYDNNFPSATAPIVAGGDGTNGKKVLEYSYQFTTNNNNVSPSKTSDVKLPILDIFRGTYDAKFHRLARDIKAYGNPVLFRLNNEMNTDWTSYCGLFNLLDPELFTSSWRYLYDIFEEEGVDNCIWIWNPFDESFPTSNWGDYFSYYPGEDYCQVLGLTSYEFNNYTSPEPDQRKGFVQRYKALYDKNKDYFLDLPWFVGEFACGAGGEPGEVGRNEDYQAAFVKEMFDAIKNKEEYVRPIKGYVWFSKNDMSDDAIVNYLKIDRNLTSTIAAFREGFASIHG